MSSVYSPYPSPTRERDRQPANEHLPACADLLRNLADLLEAGLAEHRSDPVAGALLDARIGTTRCIVIAETPTPATLSPREAQVATMVARGLTNRAIASHLDISLWTVATHLRRIFAKLGVNNRAQMVAMVCWAPSPPNSVRPNGAQFPSSDC